MKHRESVFNRVLLQGMVCALVGCGGTPSPAGFWEGHDSSRGSTAAESSPALPVEVCCGRSTWFFRYLLVILLVASSALAQGAPNERTFHQSKAAVEKALKELQTSMSGRLPILDGFAVAGEYPLNRYQRAYYQSTVQVNSTGSGGSVVRVNTKVTAWYADSAPGGSGYKVLTSNGRLETDLLDQLAEQLISMPGNVEASVPKSATLSRTERQATAEPTISAPMPNRQDAGVPFSAPVSRGLSAQELAGSKATQKKPDQDAGGLRAEATSLEEILRNQARPKNIVAVKKSGTAVVAAPSLSAKALFLASMHDEFEMLDFNRDWVHVRISGISRGWIWRDSLEMPDNIPDNPQASMTPAPAADLFQVSREETAPFPGDWEPLRGKTVTIVSVQRTRETAKDGGPEAKLEFAKFVLDKSYAELARKSQEVSGIVLIFDSADGGMIAATFSVLQRWKAGTLSDSALWHQCFFDPPETFTVVGSSSGR